MPDKGPRKPVPRTPSGVQATSDVPEVQASLSYEAFENVVKAQGISVIHYRAIPDPRGMASRGDNHDTQSVRETEDQFIYKKAGECKVIFSNNQTNISIEAVGEVNFSTAFMTLPQTYDGSRQAVIVQQWDRFFLKDVEVRVINSQFIETSATGVDRLQYPATCVEALIDADGIEYLQDVDFELTVKAEPGIYPGSIRWLGQKRPQYDPNLRRGKVYAIRYRYTPFFIVNRIVHEIRIAVTTDLATYERTVSRMPYQVEVVRERIFHNKVRTLDDHRADERFDDAPPTGGMLGPK
jgi:hypothetical protein